MLRRAIAILFVAAVMLVAVESATAQAPPPQPLGPYAGMQRAYGADWGRNYQATDWNRFYHYPYLYYPHNFWSNRYYRSANDLYHRYPPEMRIPVYNKEWHNPYPQGRLYHSGHHFILDTF